MVDILDLPMSVTPHEANVHDRVCADGVIDNVSGLTLLSVRPDESSKKFSVLLLRWIVERSFSWLENFRRIAMDYEFNPDAGESIVQLTF